MGVTEAARFAVVTREGRQGANFCAARRETEIAPPGIFIKNAAVLFRRAVSSSTVSVSLCVAPRGHSPRPALPYKTASV